MKSELRVNRSLAELVRLADNIRRLREARTRTVALEARKRLERELKILTEMYIQYSVGVKR